MTKKETFICEIRKSNLPKKIKNELIAKLEGENPDYDGFIKMLVPILKVGSICFKMFDIDIGDF